MIPFKWTKLVRDSLLHVHVSIILNNDTSICCKLSNDNDDLPPLFGPL